MIRLALRAASALSLLGSGFLIWQAGDVAALPPGMGGGLAVLFKLFEDPAAAIALTACTALINILAACVTELLLGLLAAAVSACVSGLCLIGMLGSHYPPLAQHLSGLFK